MAADLKSTAGILAILAALSILPYWNALNAGFTLDDLPNIRENTAVTRGIDPTQILATPMPLTASLYRPLTVLSFAINEFLTPGNATAFHAVNLLVHAGVTMLVFWLGVRLFDERIAMITASVFAIHPIHTEAVTSIVGRAELLAALFGLLAVLSAGPMDAATNPWGKRAWHALSVLCFSFAVFSKESAATILPLVMLYRVTRREDPLFAGMWKEVRNLDWMPYVLCFGVFVFLRLLVVGTLGGIPVAKLTPLDNVLAFVPTLPRIKSALGVLWDYFGLLNVPLVLSADYSYNQVPIVESWINPRCLAGLLLLSAATVATLCSRRPSVRFTVALPFVALLLTANLLFPIGTVKAERLLYLPSVGWALLVALGFDRLLRTPRYRSIGTVALGAIVLTFSARTWLRNGDWRNNGTVFESMAHTAPRSAKARYNFGVALQDKGALTAAVAEYKEALAIASWTEGAAFGIGVSSEKSGYTADAIQWYRHALEIAPDYDDAHTNLCHVLFDSGQFAAAVTACRTGLRYKPADANLLKGLGASLVALGDTDKGLELLRRSLALNTRDHELQIYVARLERTPAESPTEAVGVE